MEGTYEDTLEHKEALERHLAQRWQDLFGAKYDLLLYDLTSTYFEGQAEEIPIARRGHSRDSRPDALQLVLAMVVTSFQTRLPGLIMRGLGSTASSFGRDSKPKKPTV